MEMVLDNLVEAKRQLDSTIHKLKETVKTLEAKENPNRYKSQITLAVRRIGAFELSVYLIEREIRYLSENRLESSATKKDLNDKVHLLFLQCLFVLLL